MNALLGTAVRLLGVLTVITGMVYPMAVCGVARLGMANPAGGSLLRRDGRVVGSVLVAQSFAQDNYFWPRPSAGSFATVASGASNLGPASEKLRMQVEQRARDLRTANGRGANAPVPAELITTSASGLDPHLTLEAALFQVPRVARARGLPESTLNQLILRALEPAAGGWLGVSRVNVLRLNLALDGAK